ncbi:AEC family transporter [Cellulomonas sp. APG4]|uniref:AEC family transporter n=1 Tax=Cellulomonas sp. APG4 TaxID=1538656 RepID=UPI0013795228|nr:AEC family transporter [Cellulomonas sp. APG4]NCT91217.1 AEC family transporter [Cellulomonas sp. APG4]
MTAVLTALGTLAAVAALGWVLARLQVLGPGSESVLARIVFVVAAPALLAVTIAEADLGLVLSRGALVTAASTAVVALTAAVVLRGLWRRPAAEATVGTLAASYLNAGHLGIPIAVYLLGSAVAVVPVLLFQLLVLAPVAFTVLDAAVSERTDRTTGERVVAVASRTLRNPIIVAALTGLALAALPWDLPVPVADLLHLVGGTAAPLALIAFGMSLARARTRGEDGGTRFTRELLLAVVLRAVVHPALAWAIGTALGLEGRALLAVVTMAALPTAQNVLVYALHYGRGGAVARDAGLVTTLAALPVLLVVTALLGP